MKKLIYVWLVILTLCIVVSCGTSKRQAGEFVPTYLFYTETYYPGYVLDSLCQADSFLIEDYDFTNWDSYQMFTSDSVIQNVYWLFDDSLNLSISVIKPQSINKYIIRMQR